MNAVYGKVVGNTVVLDEPLPEGSEVAVYLRDDEPIELTPEDIAAIKTGLDQASRGQVISSDELLNRMDKARR